MKKVLLTMIIIVCALAVPAFAQGLGGSKLLQASWEQSAQPGGTGSIWTGAPSYLGCSFHAKHPGTYILTLKVFEKSGSDWELAASDCGTILLSFEDRFTFTEGNQRRRVLYTIQPCPSDGLGLKKIVATLKQKGVGMIDQQVSWVIVTDVD